MCVEASLDTFSTPPLRAGLHFWDVFRDAEAPGPLHLVGQDAHGPHGQVPRHQWCVGGCTKNGCAACSWLEVFQGACACVRPAQKFRRSSVLTGHSQPHPPVHTMAELKLSGNHLKHSRPVLSFDKAFDEMPHLQVLKEMFVQTFAAPRRHPKVKPFFDHVMSFSVADNRIWIRNYQVLPDPEKKKTNADDVTLVEVGPRLTLNPIKIFAGSFGGPVIYDNPTFVSPNAVRGVAMAGNSILEDGWVAG